MSILLPVQCPCGSHLGLAQQNFHEIAPPVDYSFVPTWAIFLASFVGLCLIALIVWLFKRRKKPARPPKTPRDVALEELDVIANEIETANPYQFSIRVSDILRRYVTEQFGLPVTLHWQPVVPFTVTVNGPPLADVDCELDGSANEQVGTTSDMFSG